MAEIYILAKFTDNSVVHVALQAEIRTSGATLRPQWTGAEIFVEIERYALGWAHEGKVIASWRKISQSEHELFSEHKPGERRWYRDALVDENGVLKHDIARARTLHRNRLRHYRAIEMVRLDGEWMKAMGQNLPAVTQIESRRQRLRDLPADPTIENAQSVADLEVHWDQVST